MAHCSVHVLYAVCLFVYIQIWRMRSRMRQQLSTAIVGLDATQAKSVLAKQKKNAALASAIHNVTAPIYLLLKMGQ